MSADQNDPMDQSFDLESLAVQARFLAEWRAGRRPRLSVYARRYPAYAEALAALVASLPPDQRAMGTEDLAPEIAPEAHMESLPGHLWNGEGVERALAAIFGGATPARRLSASNPPLPRVAEAPADYRAERANPQEAPQPPERD